MNLTDNLEQTIKKLRITTAADTDKRILNDAFIAFQKSMKQKSPGVWQLIIASRIIKVAALAAVVLIASTLLFLAKPEKSVPLVNVYQALENVGNVCISTFQPGEQVPKQKQWISKSMNIIMFGAEAQFDLYDVANRIRRTKVISSSYSAAVTPSEEALAEAQKLIHRPFGLLPFPNIDNISQNAQWSRIENSNIAAAVPGTKVYDLLWTSPAKGGPNVTFNKWRYFVDSRNALPKKVELYSKLSVEQDYTLFGYNVVSYPTDIEIKTLIHETFDTGPDYIGTPGQR